MNNFEKHFTQSEIIITEGALVERLKSEFDVRFDEFINHAGLLYTNPESLEALYKEYIEIGQKEDLPIMIMTPTRRVNYESVLQSEFSSKHIIRDSCNFLNGIKSQYLGYSQKVLIGGLMGCRGDAYSSEAALSTNEAYKFHRKQAKAFANQKIDYLFAGIMPELNEALGMAKAMSETGLPYIVSFMIRKDGCLIDGVPISDAIQYIDSNVNRKPVCFMTNCVHPGNLLEALNQIINNKDIIRERFKGIQANASTLSPEELNHCGVLQQGNFELMIEEMCRLYFDYGFKIFGGCCGTNNVFINQLSKKLVEIVNVDTIGS